MAAILCEPIGKCIEFVCTAPCKLVSCVCEGLCSVCTNPFSAYVFLTMVTQIPIVVVSAMSIGGLSRCQESNWLLGMLLVALCHILAAFYMAYRVSNAFDETLRNKHTSWDRVSYLLLHDPWIAAYDLVCIFFVVWLILGSIWASRNNGSTCGVTDITNYVSIALGLGWFFLFAGPTVMSCNLCCSCCDQKDYSADDAAFEAKAAAEAEAKANKGKKNEKTDAENPTTYTADGVPVNDNDNAQAAVAAEVIPAPKDGEKEQDDSYVTSISKTVGGWFGSSTTDNDEENAKAKKPGTEATVY